MTHKSKQWHFQRQLIQLPDAQRRWDRAYHNLLLWSQSGVTEVTVPSNGTATHQQQQEVQLDQSDSSVCQSFDFPPSRNSHY